MDKKAFDNPSFNRRKRIMLLYKSMIPSVRLCGHSQLENLAEKGEIEYRYIPVMRVSQEDLNWAEIVLLSRLDNVYESKLAQILKNAGKYIIYVIDDDLLNVPVTLSSGVHYAHPEAQTSIRRMISLSDAIISPSPVLLEKYAKDGQKGILLEEPAINPISYTPRAPQSTIKIGFAGSTDRSGDIDAILCEALTRIKKEYGKGVAFYFFGAIPSCASDLDATCIPYCDSYDAYRKTLNELHLDIGLAPMPDTAFHACKHYNKFIEYAAAGIVGIFSFVKPYDRLVNQFGWKLVCANTSDSWYNMIKQLLDHPEKIDAFKKELTVLTETAFSVSVIAQNLKNELLQLSVHPAQKEIHVTSLYLMKGQAFVKRVLHGLKRYGLKAPGLILRRLVTKKE